MKNIFAHLGMGGKKAKPGKPAAAKPKATVAAETEEDEDAPAAEGEVDPDDEDEEPAAEGEVDPDDEEEESAAEGEDDPEKEKEAARKAGYAKGYKAANARALKIFSSEHAGGRESLAATLAFTTNLGADAVIATLKATPAGKGGGLAAAMATQANPNLRSAATADTGKNAAASKLLANAKARAEAAVKPRR
ncbi:hypothetical protein [Parvibaculum sp.]|uniref:hypothetical protein n=1 Tax=Parvibaculum sp. TaxID=2024848 RepID=UPI00272F7D83|nr:hypothetical protein [Parvibaculum sp.]MDP1628851.1 hypothetical protein [Parvibaculum sp.]MDP2148246.1 hypothetical protein [Parvibaculum sp.]MDP3327858.1 hypothetical protein [Parvibaculum sp.]